MAENSEFKLNKFCKIMSIRFDLMFYPIEQEVV
jgi:hypothetical protein